MSRSGTRRSRWILIDGWMVDAFVESHESAPEEMVLDLDATDDPIHGQQEGRFFHGYYRQLLSPAVHLLGGASAVCGVPISMGPRDRWRNWNGSSASAELARSRRLGLPG